MFPLNLKSTFFLSILLGFTNFCIGQNSKDSTWSQTLDSVVVKSSTHKTIFLEPIQGTYLFGGRKSEVIDLKNKEVALSEKYARQLFAQIPGLFVYDMDGTGNQLNISTRGLDPHRGWEFNMRKDGIITNSDMFGYPASHFNLPMEAVDRIELVRGTGSLQFGAQFGGMLNFVSKEPAKNKAFSFENINTVGSFGLMSNYTSVSGAKGKFRVMAWSNRKVNNGYRDNSNSSFNAENISLFYDYNKNLTFKIDWSHSNYLVQLPGALTDSQFYANPRTANRSRNFYNPNIHIPSFTMNWKISTKTDLRFTSSFVLGARNSVLFDKPTSVQDTIVPSTLSYNNRQVDIDIYRSHTSEIRFLHKYTFLKTPQVFSAGAQYMNNNLHRRQQGKGTTGIDFDLSLVDPQWGRDLNFRTSHVAVFIENRIQVNKKLSISPGARIENGASIMSGLIVYYPTNQIPQTLKHNFTLFGISSQYELNQHSNVYAGISQAYRPVLFKDIIPASIYETTSDNLKDASGYNTEMGFRGISKFLKWDLSAFWIQYNNRMGTLGDIDQQNQLQILRTNIGNSQTKGLELFLEVSVFQRKKIQITAFTSSSLMDGRYQEAVVRKGTENISIKGNKVESVPTIISRNGLNVKYKTLSLSLLHSYVSETFADAFNTITPTLNAEAGLVPSYHLWDINIGYKINENITLQFNINNALNNSYFTKRPQFYPGPGIWPSDGRSFSLMIKVKL